MRTRRLTAIAISQILAIFWWVFVTAFHFGPMGTKSDERYVFMVVSVATPYNLPTFLNPIALVQLRTLNNVTPPYNLLTFLNPPWTALFLQPFHWMSLAVSTILQSCLLFGLVTLVIYKYGGGLRATLVALTSFVGFIAIGDLSIDWLAILGLLLPAALAPPFLLVTPQTGLGIVATYRPRQLAIWLASAAAMFALSLLLWGWWLPYVFGVDRSLAVKTQSPASLLGYPLSLAIGLCLLWIARKKHDRPLAIIAWLFCTPYIRPYSMLIHFAMLPLKWPRWALVFWLLSWIAGFLLIF